MKRTTLGINIVEKLKLGVIAKQDLIRELEAGEGGAEQLRIGEPRITVRFYELQHAAKSPHARGTVVPTAPVYKQFATHAMYSLGEGRVDVLRFGRLPEQDVPLFDIQVSREHGLIVLAEIFPLYCDYGTMVDGKHVGSTNGTHMEPGGLVRDAVVFWPPGHVLELGTAYTRGRHRARQFRIHYDLHALPAGN